jgi:hypothetical protein
MSPRRTLSYSDTTEVRPPRPLGQQQGATPATVLNLIRPLTAEEERATGLFATSTAIRQGWTGELADVLGALGIKR